MIRGTVSCTVMVLLCVAGRMLLERADPESRAERIEQDYTAALEAGQELKDQRQFVAAIRKFDEAIELRREEHEAYCRKAQCLSLLGRYPQAIEAAELALKYEDCALAHCVRGASRERVGQHAEAIADYEAALEQYPDWITPWNNLTWLYAGCIDEAFTDGAKALASAKRVYEIYQQDQEEMPLWKVYELLAAAHSRAGSFPEAIAFMNKALQRSPADQKNRLQKHLAEYQQQKPYHRGAEWLGVAGRPR